MLTRSCPLGWRPGSRYALSGPRNPTFSVEQQGPCNIAGNIPQSGMRLVVDTSVMVAAIRSDTGASRHLLVAGLTGRFTMLASVPLLMEYQAVMSRPEHLAASRLSVSDVEALLDAVAAASEPVMLDFLWRPALPDADDDMVLETGVNGRADAIVTFNRRHFVQVTERFGIAVLPPAEAVSRLEKRS
jgi:putative PIN family toxin of toxin-antitoxin system